MRRVPRSRPKLGAGLVAHGFQFFPALERGGEFFFDGGYSDWKRLTDERTQTARQPSEGAKSTPAHERSAPSRSRKLGFNQARELETMPARVKGLEAEQAQIGARLADPALYSNPAAEIAQLQKRYAAIEEELTAALKRWEELEAMRDKTGA